MADTIQPQPTFSQFGQTFRGSQEQYDIYQRYTQSSNWQGAIPQAPEDFPAYQVALNKPDYANVPFSQGQSTVTVAGERQIVPSASTPVGTPATNLQNYYVQGAFPNQTLPADWFANQTLIPKIQITAGGGAATTTTAQTTIAPPISIVLDRYNLPPPNTKIMTGLDPNQIFTGVGGEATSQKYGGTGTIPASNPNLMPNVDFTKPTQFVFITPDTNAPTKEVTVGVRQAGADTGFSRLPTTYSVTAVSDIAAVGKQYGYDFTKSFPSGTIPLGFTNKQGQIFENESYLTANPNAQAQLTAHEIIHNIFPTASDLTTEQLAQASPNSWIGNLTQAQKSDLTAGISLTSGGGTATLVSNQPPSLVSTLPKGFGQTPTNLSGGTFLLPFNVESVQIAGARIGEQKARTQEIFPFSTQFTQGVKQVFGTKNIEQNPIASEVLLGASGLIQFGELVSNAPTLIGKTIIEASQAQKAGVDIAPILGAAYGQAILSAIGTPIEHPIAFGTSLALVGLGSSTMQGLGKMIQPQDFGYQPTPTSVVVKTTIEALNVEDITKPSFQAKAITDTGVMNRIGGQLKLLPNLPTEMETKPMQFSVEDMSLSKAFEKSQFSMPTTRSVKDFATTTSQPLQEFLARGSSVTRTVPQSTPLFDISQEGRLMIRIPIQTEGQSGFLNVEYGGIKKLGFVGKLAGKIPEDILKISYNIPSKPVEVMPPIEQTIKLPGIEDREFMRITKFEAISDIMANQNRIAASKILSQTTLTMPILEIGGGGKGGLTNVNMPTDFGFGSGLGEEPLSVFSKGFSGLGQFLIPTIEPPSKFAQTNIEETTYMMPEITNQIGKQLGSLSQGLKQGQNLVQIQGTDQGLWQSQNQGLGSILGVNQIQNLGQGLNQAQGLGLGQMQQQLQQQQQQLAQQLGLQQQQPPSQSFGFNFETPVPPKFYFGFDLLGKENVGKKRKAKQSIITRNYIYTPTIIGEFSGRTIRKAPQSVGIQAVGIRYPVAYPEQRRSHSQKVQVEQPRNASIFGKMFSLPFQRQKKSKKSGIKTNIDRYLRSIV